MTKPYTLFGSPLSLYTGKARAYLTYKNVPFNEVFSSLSIYKKVIIPQTGVRFIPVVETPQGEFIQDTTAIIENIEQAAPERPIVPSSPKQKLVSHLLEIWADEWMVIPAMHYRWNKDNFPFVYEEFGRVVTPKMPAFVRRFLGKKLGQKFRGYVPLLGVTENSIPAIEQWYEGHVLKHLNWHFAEYQYLLGDAPTLADIALMGPLYAHLYRDPASGDIMRKLAPNLTYWVERMNNPYVGKGTTLSDDKIPNTLLPLLTRLFEEFWPVVEDTVSQVSTWVEQNPNSSEIPRRLNEHIFTIGDTSEKRMVLPFMQWKAQRVVDVYLALSAEDKQAVHPLLEKIGGVDAMSLSFENRLKREHNKLVLDR